VKKVNPQATAALVAELKSRSRTRRLRGLGVAAAMDMVAEVEAAILELLKDDDHMVRADAARALAQCDRPATQAALQEALSDSSVSVQDAAEQSLQALKNRKSGNRWERLL
jgi:HEAT repeat protein